LADKVLIYDTGASGYERYGRKLATGDYHSLTNWNGPAVDPALVAGQGFWIQTGSGTSDLELSFTGEAVEAVQQQVGIVSGYQQGGYPFSATRDANDSGLNLAAGDATPGASPALADQILVWNSGKQGYDRYALRTGVGWVSATNWNGGVVEADLPLGVGFWYNAKNPFTWTEAQPYTID
jgi:hypothetical protein